MEASVQFLSIPCLSYKSILLPFLRVGFIFIVSDLTIENTMFFKAEKWLHHNHCDVLELFFLRYSLSFPCNTIQNIRIEVRDFEKKKPKTFFGWKDLKTKTLGFQSIALENKECLCANGIYKNLEMYTKKGGRWTQLNRIRKRTDHVSLETKCDQVIRKCQQDLKQNVASWFNKTQLISLQSWVLCFAKNR